jgi:CPA2 family monovalent cation:H+ antiporter-2/glutathione-regulated potassium-efflux system protein KefB
MASDIPVTLIDSDTEMIDVAGGFGAKVWFGDGTRLDLLRQAGADEAELILFCIDGDQLTADAVEAVHEAFPQAAIYVRGYDRRAMIRLGGTPATVVRELLESAMRMARLALDGLGLSPEDIDRAEDMYRARDRERLKTQIETGDIRAARDRIITEPGQREP